MQQWREILRVIRGQADVCVVRAEWHRPSEFGEYAVLDNDVGPADVQQVPSLLPSMTPPPQGMDGLLGSLTSSNALVRSQQKVTRQRAALAAPPPARVAVVS